MKTYYRMYVNGQWLESKTGRTCEVINPATEEVIAEVAYGGVEEARLSLEAAQNAQRRWYLMPAIERAKYLHQISEIIQLNKEHLAKLLVKEQGKTIIEARKEIEGAKTFFSYFGGLARNIEGEMLPADEKNQVMFIARVPYGVVSAIIPWNYPLGIFARKVAPALIAGNSIVVKPSTLTPISTLELIKLIDEETSLPAGLINVVTGKGKEVGEELVKNPITKLVTMTGSVESGKRILELASQNVTNISLELGGKAPFIVWNDADLGLAVKGAVRSRFTFCGQVCNANERMYIHEQVFDKFVEQFVEKVQSLHIGDPTKEETDVGPLISEKQLKKVKALVERAKQEGAKVVLGGERLRGGNYRKGYWYKPTVLVDVRQDMEIMQKEIFGPVIPIMKISEFDEAIELCNDCLYGLSSYVFTQDLKRVMCAIRDIDFGEIYINRIGAESVQGFHAGYRQSGIGGDDGRHGLEQFLQKKTVYLDYGKEDYMDDKTKKCKSRDQT